MADHSFKLKAFRDLLYGELGCPILSRTRKTHEPGMDAVTLDLLADQRPDLPWLRDYTAWRSLESNKTKYVDKILAARQPDRRVHAAVNFLPSAWAEEDEGGTGGAVTGRWSMKDPPLHQIPRTTPDWDFRCIYTPEKGRSFLYADLASLEFFLIAMVSGDPGLLALAVGTPEPIHTELVRNCFGADAAVDVHRVTAGLIHSFWPDGGPVDRDCGKRCVYALSYGAESFRIHQALQETHNSGYPRMSASAFHHAWHELFPGVREWHERVLTEAHETGWITTSLGFRRQLEWPIPDPRKKGLTASLEAPGGKAAINAHAQQPGAYFGQGLLMETLRAYPDLRCVLSVHDSGEWEGLDSIVQAAYNDLPRIMVRVGQRLRDEYGWSTLTHVPGCGAAVETSWGAHDVCSTDYPPQAIGVPHD